MENGRKQRNDPQRFKYYNHLELFQGCPPKCCVEAKCIAYRFVTEPLDEQSFIPVALMPFSASNGSNRQLSCSRFGLSMFKTAENARVRFAELKNKYKNIRKRIGDHLAEISLEPSHGVQTRPNRHGHFDLHEYKGVSLVSVAKIIEEL